MGSRRHAELYKEAVGVHGDELTWLSNHQPDACYADEYERWRGAVEDLRAAHRNAQRFVRAGNKQGVQRTTRQRQQAMKRLNRAMSSVADCGPSVPSQTGGTTADDPLVGKWKSYDNWIMPDGFHNSSRLTFMIDQDGAYAFRDSNAGVCRQTGWGYVPFTRTGPGEFDLAGRPTYTGHHAKGYCHPRGGRGRKPMGDGGPALRYDAAADVGYSDFGYCWWRDGVGSRADCTAFFRGETPARLLESAPNDESAPAESE